MNRITARRYGDRPIRHLPGVICTALCALALVAFAASGDPEPEHDSETAFSIGGAFGEGRR